MLEVNPKVWGTTHLTTIAGLNMVQNIIDSMLGKDFDLTDSSYDENVLYKWLFPECLLACLKYPYYKIPMRVHRTLKNYNADKVTNNIKHSGIRQLIASILK